MIKERRDTLNRNSLTYETWPEHQLPEFAADHPLKGADRVLRWTYDTYGDRVVYSCSFGVESIVLIDLINQIKEDATVLFLDTDFHFKETYELVDRVEGRYPRLHVIRQKPLLTPAEQAAKYGASLWSRQPDLCCRIRKVEPLSRSLKNYDAWISGLRHEQSPTRRNVQSVNKDEKFQSIKICPLIHWTWQEVWDYVRLHNLPYNPLHDRNYPSIGCAYCTSPVTEGGDLRAGRWSAFDKTECGLHINSQNKR